MALTLEALLSGDDDDREAALRALAAAPEADKAALLPGLFKEIQRRLKGAKDDSNGFEHPAAALLAIGGSEAEAAVAAAADHKSAEAIAFSTSIPALAQRADLDRLEVWLGDADPSIRAAAAQAVGRLHAHKKRFAKKLDAMTKDPSKAVARAAKTAREAIDVDW